jgi:hypothetical protein
MHDTVVRMKDGRVHIGPIYMFRPKEGWMSLMLNDRDYPDDDMPDKLYFRDMESAVTSNQRGRVGKPGIGPEDELERARYQGWDGT